MMQQNPAVDSSVRLLYESGTSKKISYGTQSVIAVTGYVAVATYYGVKLRARAELRLQRTDVASNIDVCAAQDDVLWGNGCKE